MKGTRPLDNDDIRRVSNCFDGIFEARNRGVFMLGVSIGGHAQKGLTNTCVCVAMFLKPIEDCAGPENSLIL